MYSIIFLAIGLCLINIAAVLQDNNRPLADKFGYSGLTIIGIVVLTWLVGFIAMVIHDIIDTRRRRKEHEARCTSQRKGNEP